MSEGLDHRSLPSPSSPGSEFEVFGVEGLESLRRFGGVHSVVPPPPPRYLTREESVNGPILGSLRTILGRLHHGQTYSQSRPTKNVCFTPPRERNSQDDTCPDVHPLATVLPVSLLLQLSRLFSPVQVP